MRFNKQIHLHVYCAGLSLLVLLIVTNGVHAQGSKTPRKTSGAQASSGKCARTISANVAALDQPYMLNRLGAAMPQGMIFALTEDVYNQSCSDPANPACKPCSDPTANCKSGQVMLRSDKRPRPIVLRMNVGDCLQVKFTNLLNPATSSPPLDPLQPVTRLASIHANGMELVNGISDDGSWVGANQPTSASGSLVTPKTTNSPGIGTYTFYASAEGSFLLYSMGAAFGGFGSVEAGQLSDGMFGAVNVQPASVDPKTGQPAINPTTGQPYWEAEWYRSQVTKADLDLVTQNQGGRTVINYDKVYPPGQPHACKPVLKMLDYQYNLNAGQCVPDKTKPMKLYYTDLTAVITGPNHGRFPKLFNGPEFNVNPVYPDRWQPYREFTIHYHELMDAVQAFQDFYDPLMASVLNSGQDNFAINYGTGGIGAEILANRLQVGPMMDCPECKFEEFFLSSWTVGDPAMVVDAPANIPFPYPGTGKYSQPNKPNVESELTTALEQVSISQPQQPNPQIGSPSKTPAGPFPKARKAFYPDDPSNVYHSYLNDHVKFRILNVGGQFTHVHHQHAHQWLHSPNNDDSAYLDSQVISPGAAFTLEMVYNGSGNRNKTAGDSIFHCHFYPHFAAGMWSMWRVHDVFEAGTDLYPKDTRLILRNGTIFDGSGVPKPGGRALPDGEIALALQGGTLAGGTPIPGIVPLPTLAMAPAPARTLICGIDANWNGSHVTDNGQCPQTPVNPLGYISMTLKQDIDRGLSPGFPFFIPGVAGHRPPHPPFDFAYEIKDGNKEYLDGGLPRHVVLDGEVSNEHHNQWDFSKDTDKLLAKQLPEDGTRPEQAAMAFNGQRQHSSFTPEGTAAFFTTNGLPRKPGRPCPGEPGGLCKAENSFGSQLGAPFADPGMLDDGNPVGSIRRYKAANIQMDVAFNKKGWHYPQQRMITLWGDVAPTIKGDRMPEPFFFRANSLTDIVEYWHTNLVPDYYELDDFQVRTPTDILGQHIHLVKFDVLASDGAANGFNYEDGTLSPDEVQARISAIRRQNNCPPSTKTEGLPCPSPKAPPAIFGPAPAGQNWLGAQTTVQRWYADPVNNNNGVDRTLRTVFTHDHFGPSTHQQAGLYAGLLIEPTNSTWQSVDGKGTFGTRDDGGPTSWQANIIAGNRALDSYREFALEFQDLAMAYDRFSIPKPKPYDPNYTVITKDTAPWGWADCKHGINLFNGCPQAGNSGFGLFQVQPQLIAASPSVGTSTVSYRNEPPAFRINDPACQTGTCHNPFNKQTDLSYVFSSQIPRIETDLNIQPNGPLVPGSPFKFPGPFSGAQPMDPYTPLLRAYQNDKVQIRVLVGAHLFQHSFSMHGLKWLFEPSAANSGYRDNQTMGISEHFEFLFDLPSTAPPVGPPPQKAFSADYLYAPGTGLYDTAHGLWGIFRTFNAGGDPNKLLPDLATLPNNLGGGRLLKPGPDLQVNANCPLNAPRRRYDISVIYGAAQVNGKSILPNGQLVYNDRIPGNPVVNPNPLIYVASADLNPDGSLKNPGAKREPLILRAAAGECLEVTLRNRINPNEANTKTFFTTNDPNAGNWTINEWSPTEQQANPLSYFPSVRVGLHAQMVSYDVTQNNGVNIGFNPEQTVGPTDPPRIYQWYAGNLARNDSPTVAGSVVGTPIELGSANLLSSDPMEHLNYGLIAGVVIEPPGSVWCTIPTGLAPTCSNVAPVMNASVDVKPPNPALQFREFALIVQNKVYLQWKNSTCNPDPPNLITTNVAVNFGTEPMGYRNPSVACFNDGNGFQIGNMFSNSAVANAEAGENGEPRTPIYIARPGQPVRFRMFHPDGFGGFPDTVPTLHGHVWQEEPFVNGVDAYGKTIPSALLGNNTMSQWMGSRDGFGPQAHFDILISNAGGFRGVVGDYLYRSFPSFPEFQYGIWGVFRVCLQCNTTRLALAAKRAPRKRVTALAAAEPTNNQQARPPVFNRFKILDRAHETSTQHVNK